MKKLLLVLLVVVGVAYFFNRESGEADSAIEQPESELEVSKPAAATKPAPPQKTETTPLTNLEPEQPTVRSKDQVVNGYLDEAIELLQTGNAEDALTVLKGALAEHPDDSALLTQMGLMNSEIFNEPDVAAGYLARAVESDPNNATALNKVVDIYDKSGNLEKAEAILRNLPDNSQAAVALGDVYLRQGKPDLALQQFDKNGDNQAPALRAVAYTQSGRHDEAIEIHNRLYEENVRRYNASGRKADAKKAASTSLDAALAHLAAGQPEKARQFVESAREMDPHNQSLGEVSRRIDSAYATN